MIGKLLITDGFNYEVYMKKIQRIIALLGVVILLGLVITTLIFAITGNPNFWGMFVVTLLFPVLLWVYMFVYKLIKDKQ